MNLNLPLYNITPDMTDENQGMFLVSLVEEPAVEIDFLAFAKENLLFAVQDTEKHIVTGVSILADTPIYRRNKNGEFYVQFRKEDIPAIVEKFMQRGLSNFINIQHDETTLSNTDAVLVESYFVNKERGIVPNEFVNVTDGSWITSYKILNEDIWQQIKSGDLKGFSIEISSELELAMEKQPTEEEQMDKEIISNCFAEKVIPVNSDTSIVDQISIPKDNIDMNTFNEASVEYAIENHKIVLLTYTGNEATSFRQGAVSAYGYTSAGNKAIRFHEFSGASQSGTMDWKILLWDDVREFHVIDYLQTWSASQIGYTGEMGLDGPGFLQNAHEAPMW